jgi:hypothetical protein
MRCLCKAVSRFYGSILLLVVFLIYVADHVNQTYADIPLLDLLAEFRWLPTRCQTETPLASAGLTGFTVPFLIGDIAPCQR